MAWEMQGHMVGRILPSVEAYLETQDDAQGEAARILTWLAPWSNLRDEDGCYTVHPGKPNSTCPLLDNAKADVVSRGLSWAARTIAKAAEKEAATTNGGWAFYVDSGGWVSIPWKEEDTDGEAN